MTDEIPPYDPARTYSLRQAPPRVRLICVPQDGSATTKLDTKPAPGGGEL